MTLTFFTYFFLLALIAGIGFQFFLAFRQVSHVNANRNHVPSDFIGKIPLQAHQKAADYTQAKVRFSLFDIAINGILLIIWTLGGGLQFVDAYWRSFNFSMLWTGTGVLLSTFAIITLLEIPFSIYRHFVLEQRFGFNKMTAKIFISDTIKNTLLGFVIGTPLILVVLWFMSATQSYWWVYVWFTWLGFSVFMMWAYPAFIAPLFNKFRPLEDAQLKQRIIDLLSRNGFKSQGIFVVDGSSRSTHGNAYFTGLGSNKRIVFFDTLINKLSYDEIEAVLAHELGHFKRYHIIKRIAVLSALSFLGLAVLSWLVDSNWFYVGLGVSNSSDYMALALFLFVLPVFTLFLKPVFSFMSRQHEFEADDFAAAQVHARHLISSLISLYQENANTLTPEPLYSAVYDSHPPAPVRIAHLNSKLA